MHSWDYTVEVNGQFKTVRTTGGHLGAFRMVTNDKPVEWRDIPKQDPYDSHKYIVKGTKFTCTVTKLPI